MRSGEPGGEPKVVKQGRGRQEGRVCTGQAVRGFGGPAGGVGHTFLCSGATESDKQGSDVI